MQIQWAPSPNFRAGREGRKIIAIVNHITAGLMPGTLSWMQNPSAKASAHYLVTKKGEIYQMVKDEDTAYHAGEVQNPSWSVYDGSNPNNYTLGIEHEALSGDVITEAQYQATLWLHGQLVKKYTIPVDRDHIIGHYRIDSVNRKNDPGVGFPWDRLFKDLASDSVQISIGKVIIAGLLIGGTSYAPIRQMAEALGRKVTWDAASRTVMVE